MSDRWNPSNAEGLVECGSSVSTVSGSIFIDLNEAHRFLAFLDPTANNFTFQVFADSNVAAAQPARNFSAPFDDASAELSRLNRAGAGVFVTANVTDGNGRKLQNITRIRAIWQDDDQGWAGPFPLSPSATIETSPGRYQRWWLLDAASRLSHDEHRGVMRRMVLDYGCDANAVDAARVLRLPGFLHQKRNPFRVRIADGFGPTYSAGALLAAFPPPPPVGKLVSGPRASHACGHKFAEVEEALRWIPAETHEIWLQCGMALHDFTGGSQNGFDLWSQWSQTAPSKFDAARQLTTWKSFGSRNGVTVSTIFHLAKSFGAGLGAKTRSRTCSVRAPEKVVPPDHADALPDMSIINRNQLPVPPFPVELLGPIQDWLRAAAAARSAPVDFVALGLIATAAGLLGPSLRVSPWSDWTEPSVIWACLVGVPSSNKSPALDPLRDAVREVERQAGTSGAAERQQRLLISDTTTEKAAQLLSENPNGLICIRDELAGLLGAFGRYGSSVADRAFWIEAYGGRHHVVDRVKHDKPIDIPFCGISVVGGIQPERLATLLLSGDDDGLSSRFLYAWPAPQPRRRTSVALDRELVADAFRRLHAVGVGRQGEPQIRIIKLEPFAADEFQAWYEREEHDGWATALLESAYGKLHGTVLRLALVIEFLVWAVERRNEAEPSAVSANSVTAAINIIEDWVRPTLQRVFAEASMPKAHRDAMIIGRWLLKERPSVINSRGVRRTAGFPGPKDARDLEAALEPLVEADWLFPAPNRQGSHPGRRRDDYRVNPLVYELADAMAANSANRASSREPQLF